MKSISQIRNVLFVFTLCVLTQVSFAYQTGSIPTPESVIGFKPGTDYKLANWDQISGYFKALDDASDRIIVRDIGETEMGNRMLMAVISSPENLRSLRRLKEIQHKLADPRKMSDDEVAQLVREGKTVVLMTCSLHGTEVGASQMSSILAYQLATGNDKNTRDILENVVFVLFPSANPDGVMLIANHYMQQNPGPGVEIRPLPRLYSKYTGHDNNRDWYMLTQKESKLIARQLYKEWLPEIVMDMHQMGNRGARFFLPPFTDPLNPVIHPFIVRELQLIGGYFNSDLIDGGYPWVENQRGFTMWWHGGMRTAPYFHNMVGILSEAASANLASPIPPTDGAVPMPTINYPVPWNPNRSWTIGDIVEQDRIAALALLKCAARNKDMFLKNFYTMNKDAIEKGKTEKPFAYIMPLNQHDIGAFQYFLEIMLRQKTEFYQASEDFTAGGEQYSEGSIIAYLSQPSRAHVEAIFGIQKYPETARRPYDITGWTLPLQMGVDYDRVENSFVVRSKPFTEARNVILSTKTTAETREYLIDPNSLDHYKAVNRLLKRGYTVSILTEKAGDNKPGTVIVKYNRNIEREWGEIIKGLSLKFIHNSQSVQGETVRLRDPRIAMVDNPTSMPVGWMRWIMDTHEFEYTMIDQNDVLNSNLNRRFDVILFPASFGSGSRQRGSTQQREIRVPAEIKEKLKLFVENNGTIVAWGSNGDYVIKALDLDIVSAVPAGDQSKFSIPGSILKSKINMNSPITYGMQKDAFVFYGRGSTVWKTNEGTILGRYVYDNPLMSGYLLGSEYIKNTPNVIHIRRRNGNIILIGFDPVYRAQPVASFKLVFNSILYSAFD